MGTMKKGDEEVLDYSVNWSTWLSAQEDSIATSTWRVPAGLTQVSDQATTDSAVVKISGGIPDELYEITNIITTAAGLTAERTMKILVVEHRYK